VSTLCSLSLLAVVKSILKPAKLFTCTELRSQRIKPRRRALWACSKQVVYARSCYGGEVHEDGKKLRPQLRRDYKQTIKRVSESTVSLRVPIFAGCHRASGRWAVQFESFTVPLMLAPKCQPAISPQSLKLTEKPFSRCFSVCRCGKGLRNAK